MCLKNSYHKCSRLIHLLARNFATPDMNSWYILLVRYVYLIPDDNAAGL